MTHHHSLGIAHFAAARLTEALASFRSALSDSDSAELWNDWATAQFSLGRSGEAQAGFHLALAANPPYLPAALNLAALLLSQNRPSEAFAVLQPALPLLPPDQRAQAEILLQPARSASPGEPAESQIAAALDRFASPDPNEQSYFATHRRRYIEILKLLPAAPGEKILELGAAFHHLTPALASLKRFSEVRCNDLWDGPPRVSRQLVSAQGSEVFHVPVDNFDIQRAPWPYDDASFHTVLFCEMLEHLHSDPMAVCSEINRVLRPGGHLLLTTPNLASCHSVEYALRGDSPYVYGKFEAGGAPTDRHNREYTPGEVERLALAAGFEPLRLETRYSWWQPDRAILRLLASRGEPIALRGDNIFLLARKVAPVRDRFPEEFYLHSGTQSLRRAVQDASQADADSSQPPSPPSRAQRVLVIHDLVPHFDQSGSDLRLLDVLREIRAQGHHLTLFARDDKNAEPYSAPLSALGIRVVAGDPEHLKHLGRDDATVYPLRALLQNQSFDLAILCHWFWSGISVPEHYLADIRRLSPSTRIAILTDDRHGERERRAAELSGLFSDRERAADFEFRELAAYRAADLLLYITEADRAHFVRLLPDVPMLHLPIIVSAAEHQAPPTAGRTGVLFLGNFENLANRDALNWLLSEIWPLVQKRRPSLKLFIAGNACPSGLPLRSDSIVALGKVPSLAATFRDRLALVAPIRFGTGINTKNLQALAHGLPVLTTSIGAEGLALRHEVDALIADSPRDFAENILRICDDPTLRETLARNGRVLVAANFSASNLSASLRQLFARSSALPRSLAIPPDLASYRQVENACPEVLTALPAGYRSILRTLGYWQLGSGALAKSDPAAALRHFRHIFTTLRGAVPATVFHRRLLTDMAEAFRLLLQPAGALRCERELQNLVALNSASAAGARHKKRRSHRESGTPQLSVVIPTHNRKLVLSFCLAAFSFQTLPATEWEIIVVDDGCSDGTPEFLRSSPFPFPLTVLSQPNQGAGAARRAGVLAARGRCLLLCNDDTIPSSTLLAEHLRLLQLPQNRNMAILGQFSPSAQCIHRALSFWINRSPFLFPQQTLKPGQLCDSALFVTCNLSLPRQAVLDAGNFDPAFRVAEDTEMGARLEKLGYRVRFEPSAIATHEHSLFTSDDLLRRAALYGPATWQLLRKHPQLLGDGTGPFGTLSDSDLGRLRAARNQKTQAAESGLAALRALDDFDLDPLWLAGPDGVRPVDAVIEKVAAIVPTVYWHELFEHFLAAADADRAAQPAPSPSFAPLAAS